MADNYLEKKMEEHRRGASLPARHTPTFIPAGAVCFRLGEMRVLVVRLDADPAAGSAIVRAFRRAACKVAFVWDDRTCGSRLAQESGSRHYPFGSDSAERAIADLHKVWGGVDLIIEVESDGVRMGGRRVWRGSGCTPEVFSENIGDVCLYLALPQSCALIDFDMEIAADGSIMRSRR
ncbi:MAG: hypothetical protein NC418_02875 [Muribaculaceae bacterium]|nr:hypothetical protein [Muribaculaceae bacterium]